MSNDLRIKYRPRLDATPEAEVEALATVYSFLIQCRENRKAALSGSCANISGGEGKQSTVPSGSGGLSATNRREDDSDKPSEQREEVITE